MSAALDVRGNPVAWKHRLCGSSVFSRYHPNLIKNGVDPDAVAGAAQPREFPLHCGVEITLTKGRVVQSNFHDYRPMRMNEAPIVETHVVQSSEPPGGVGEVPTATVSPAVANAVFAATGKRIRRLPIKALDAVL